VAGGTVEYDVAIVGAGPGGYVAAIRAAQLGLSTVIVDRRETFGGTCLNVGCIPSKALLDSSELYERTARHLGAHGILVKQVELDLGAMMARKRAIVSQLTGGVAALLSSNRVTTHRGDARLSGPGTLEVTLAKGGTIGIRARAIILATGSTPVTLPFLPVDGKRVLTSTEALELPAVPARLAVIGAGAVGLEIGSIWARLGSAVAIVELMPEILPGFHVDAARLLHRSLGRQGLTIHTGARITEARVQDDGVTLSMTAADGTEHRLEAEVVLVAVGRRPATGGLGLEAAGVIPDRDSGRILVNERHEAAPGIYAIGDLAPGPALAHKAEDEGMAVAEIIAGRAGHVRYDTIPLIVYTHPEVACVGATEETLRAAHVAYRKGSFPFRANGRALAMDGTEGHVKILADAVTDRVLGAHMVGPHVSELISEIVAVMEFGGSAEDVARTVHAHPTLTEVVREAALDVDGRSIHAPAGSSADTGLPALPTT
jgi:dihydrolipoamide dehydrogenase